MDPTTTSIVFERRKNSNTITKMTSINNNTELGRSNVGIEAESIATGLQESSSDQEKPKDGKECDEIEKDDLMNLTFLSLLLLLIALQFSFLLSQYIIDNDSGITASVSLVASMSLGIVAMVVLFEQIRAGMVHMRGKTRLNMQVNAILRNNLSLVGIVFFCPFACFLDIFQIFTEMSCGESWKMIGVYPFYINDVIFCVLHIIFMTTQLMFCVQFRRFVLKENVSKLRKFCVKLSLTFVVAANLGLWYNAILHETATAGTNRPEDSAGNDSVHSNETCLLRAFGDVEETVRRSLYPFTVEFSVLVLEFLASHLIFHRQHNEHETELDQSAKPSSENLQEHRQESLVSVSGAQRGFAFGLTSPLLIIFGVLPNLVFFAFAFFSRDDNLGNEVLHSVVLNKKRYMVFYRILLILLITVGFVCARNFKSGKDRLKGIDFLVIASAFGPTLCFIIRIIAITENLEIVSKVYNPGMILFFEALNLIEVLLQLPFMFYADGVKGPSKEEGRIPRWRIFKAMVLSVALGNITLWILDSVLLNIDIVSTIFQKSGIPVIDAIFRPFTIFFRFHSFLILLRAFLL